MCQAPPIGGQVAVGVRHERPSSTGRSRKSRVNPHVQPETRRRRPGPTRLSSRRRDPGHTAGVRASSPIFAAARVRAQVVLPTRTICARADGTVTWRCWGASHSSAAPVCGALRQHGERGGIGDQAHLSDGPLPRPAGADRRGFIACTASVIQDRFDDKFEAHEGGCSSWTSRHRRTVRLPHADKLATLRQRQPGGST